MTEIRPALEHVRERERARGNAAEHEREKLRRKLEKHKATRECVRCGDLYEEMGNFGTWRCRYHWGNVESEHFEVAGVEAGHWTCCRRPTGSTRPRDDEYYANGERYRGTRSRGCTRCDHVATINAEHEPRRRLDRLTAFRLLGEDYAARAHTVPGQSVKALTPNSPASFATASMRRATPAFELS